MSSLTDLINSIHDNFGPAIATKVMIPAHRTKFEPRIENNINALEAKSKGTKIVIEIYTLQPIKNI